MEMINTSSNNPLSFFEELIKGNGAELLYKEFVPSEHQLTNGEIVGFHQGGLIKIYRDFDSRDGTSYESYTSFADEILKPRLKEECKIIKGKAKSAYINYSPSQLKRYFNRFTHELKFLYSQIELMKFKGIGPVIKSYLKYTSSFLKREYGIDSALDSQITVEPQKLSFRLRARVDKQKLMYCFNELNDTVQKTGFIENNMLELVEVFTSDDVLALGKIIQLSCTTQEAAFIFRNIQPYFKNLRFSTIGRSGTFKTSSGKDLTANDLYNGLKEFSDTLAQNNILFALSSLPKIENKLPILGSS